jgi:hypothetical protein
MIGRRKSARRSLDVVTSVQDQTQQAAELAAIAGQARLADPRTNPATRGHADQLRDAQHLKALDAEHTRLLRQHRVADRRAGEAERTLEAIALARRASSPARSVLALHVGKRRRLRVCLAASLALGVGSALGVEAAAEALHAPWGSGYIAEVGLTGLATAAITYRAHLAEHRGEVNAGSWQSKTLWTAMTVPLLVSVACNLATLDVVGAFCAIFAAAWSLLACVVADRSSAAMQARAGEVSGEDELEIRQVAMGDDLFVPVPDNPEAAGDDDQGADEAGAEEETGLDLSAEEPQPLTDWVQDVVDRGAAELEAWLAEGLDDGADDGTEPVPPASGPEGGQRAVSPPPAAEPVTATMRPPVHIDADQHEPESADPSARVVSATQARIAIGASTRQRVASYVTRHPEASVEEIGQALRLSRTTVKRHRRELREGGDRS